LDERPPSGRLRRLYDAPLIGERAATRGRIATEGGDEQAGARRRYPFALPALANRIELGKLDPARRFTRPVRRTPSRLREVVTAVVTACVFAADCVAGHDPPLLGDGRNARAWGEKRWR
jgi:hypothetical protein